MSPSVVALEKGLPANLDAERFVLGSILLDDSYFIQTAGALDADDFRDSALYDADYRRRFRGGVA